jgi:hypothetical protein
MLNLVKEWGRYSIGRRVQCLVINGIAEFKAKPTSLDPKIKPNETPKNECQEVAAVSCKGSH